MWNDGTFAGFCQVSHGFLFPDIHTDMGKELIENQPGVLAQV